MELKPDLHKRETCFIFKILKDTRDCRVLNKS